MTKPEQRSPSVALFVTCLVDVMRPSIAFAAVSLLERAGCQVSVPESQTCCGQPGYNAGHEKNARLIAQQVIETFEGYDYVVTPSGSCAGTLKKHYPEMFAGNAAWRGRAEDLSSRTWELTSFLTDQMNFTPSGVRFNHTVSYHDSCSGLRELGVKDQPRKLLAAVDGTEIAESDLAESCCGFGGLFCVKYPDISAAMVDHKIGDVMAGEADVVLGGDLGCLMNLAGRLTRKNLPTKVWHVAEVLAGMTDKIDPITGPSDDEAAK
ncbi:MAG: (Fe-S)-binding protein [Rhodospirillaceae bacterium]|nr:(Fe-S)-binding protein [Rhodospirillaceae bacterium]